MGRLSTFTVTFALAAAALVGVQSTPAAQDAIAFGSCPDSLKFSVIGDMGTAAPPRSDIARQMSVAPVWFPFELVLMTVDNMSLAADSHGTNQGER